MTALARVNLLLFAALVAHTLDHAVNQPVRQGPALGAVIGVLGFVIVAASTVLALRGSPVAAPATLFAGVATEVGIAAVHLLPAWSSAISDPYWDFHANAVSWALALAPLVAGAVAAIVALRELQGGPAPA